MTGWTGGQYSLVRGLLAAYLLVRLFPTELDAPAWRLALSLLGLAAAVAFGLGMRRRVAAVVLAALLIGPPGGNLAAFPLGGLVLLQVFVPPAPYGSWTARGRPDPAGSWQLPGAVRGACLLLFCLWILFFLLDLPGAGVPGLEPLVLLAFALDPGWLPPRRGDSPELAYYDGECGLCHGFVRFCLSEDRDGGSFRFAPLQGPTFEERVAPEVRANVPDSFVLERTDGTILVRSSATGHMLCSLGGYWRLLGRLLLLIPRPLRDLGYDTVARFRKRLFAQPEGLCPIVPPHLGGRFLP